MTNDKNFEDEYNDFMRGYEKSPFIDTEWPMKDGMYQQYSGWDNDAVGVSGTVQALIML